jgi:hypothetical protein
MSVIYGRSNIKEWLFIILFSTAPCFFTLLSSYFDAPLVFDMLFPVYFPVGLIGNTLNNSVANASLPSLVFSFLLYIITFTWWFITGFAIVNSGRNQRFRWFTLFLIFVYSLSCAAMIIWKLFITDDHIDTVAEISVSFLIFFMFQVFMVFLISVFRLNPFGPKNSTQSQPLNDVQTNGSFQ